MSEAPFRKSQPYFKSKLKKTHHKALYCVSLIFFISRFLDLVWFQTNLCTYTAAHFVKCGCLSKRSECSVIPATGSKLMFDRNVSVQQPKTNSQISWEHLTWRLEALCNASWEDNYGALSNSLFLRQVFWDSGEKNNKTLCDTGGAIWEYRLWNSVFLLFDTYS